MPHSHTTVTVNTDKVSVDRAQLAQVMAKVNPFTAGDVVRHAGELHVVLDDCITQILGLDRLGEPMSPMHMQTVRLRDGSWCPRTPILESVKVGRIQETASVVMVQR